MPTLPPRNLPFSPPTPSASQGGAALPQTPNPARSERARLSSPAAAASISTPSKVKEDESGDGMLPRQEETTYHRKLRSLLWDFRKAYEKWIDLVSSQGAKSIARTAQLCASLDDILGKEAKETGKARIAWKVAERMDALIDVIRDIDEAKEESSEVMARIAKVSGKLAAISDAAENLLVDATEHRGSDFTFEREMWLTWSMDDLVTAVQQIASRCAVQTAHLQLLGRLLVESGYAPGESFLPSAPTTERRNADDDDEEGVDDSEEDEEEDTAKGGKYDSKRKRKGRSRLREKVLEDWQRLEILYDETCPVDPDIFEDICEAEVGRWEER